MLIKRGAGFAAGAVLLGLGLVPATAPASAADAYSCTATPTYPTVWNGGFDVQYVITNTGTQPINSWVVTFDMPGNDTIYTIWNGQLTQSGHSVVAKNVPTPSSTIAPGGSMYSFGGVVIGSGGTGITNITCTASFIPIHG